MKKGKIKVGTSGWLYKHWRGTFYPPGLSQKEEFNYYRSFFKSLEVNNTFYKLPKRAVFEEWRRLTDTDFRFVVKAGRFITHMLKLKNPELALQRFFDNVTALEEKLELILFQLPPDWKLNLERFDLFLKALPKGFRYAFEFRNETWYAPAVYKLLKKYKCAFCIYQLAGHMSPIVVTTDFVYLRLHGPTQHKYQGSYDFYTLRAWAEKSREWQSAGKDVYIYFDNDESGYAAFNAQVMEMMLNKDEPITKQEADVLALVIAAIRERKQIEFYYETQSGKGWRKVEPHLIALKNNGRGNIFFTGYVHPSSGIKRKDDNKGQYLLNKIDLTRFSILDEEPDVVRPNPEVIFGELTTERVVYRGVMPKTKKKKTAIEKLPSKKSVTVKKAANSRSTRRSK